MLTRYVHVRSIRVSFRGVRIGSKGRNGVGEDTDCTHACSGGGGVNACVIVGETYVLEIRLVLYTRYH